MTEPVSTSAPAPPSAAPVRTRTPRWLIALLVLSLAANALVVGVVLRSMWHLRSAAAMSVDGLPSTFGSYVRQLPQQRQDELRRDLTEGRPRIFALRRELRQARQEAAQKFVAEPFDKVAFAAALARIRTAETSLREVMQSRMPDIAASMSLEERRAFLRWWDRRGGPRRFGGGGPGGDDGPPGRGGGGRRGE